MNSTSLKVFVSSRTLLFAIALCAALWSIAALPDLVIILLASWLIADALAPFVSSLSRFFPNPVAILLVYVGLFGPVLFLLGLILSIAIEQTLAFSIRLPSYWALLQTTHVPLLAQFGPQLGNLLSHRAESLILGGTSWLSGVIQALLGALIVLLSVFFLLLDRKAMMEGSLSLFPAVHRPLIARQYALIAKGLRAFFTGRALSMVSLALLLSVGFSLIKLPHPIFLATLAGMLEIVPFFGSITGLLLATLIALSVSWKLVLWVWAIFAVAGLIHGNILSPLILARTTTISPFLLFFILLLGSKLLGTKGAILALPVAIVVGVLLKELYIPYMNRQSDPD